MTTEVSRRTPPTMSAQGEQERSHDEQGALASRMRALPLALRQVSLRDRLAAVALEKHRVGLGGELPAVERRPWDFWMLFEGLS